MKRQYMVLCLLVLIAVLLLSVGNVSLLATEKTWDFLPEPDRFDAAFLENAPLAYLDLRDLNEAYAGESGFVRLSQDGRDFVLGNGIPIRFWAVNSSVWKTHPTRLGDHARFLAKRGVNMVRWHGLIASQVEGDDLGDINEVARDQIWQSVAAMKHEGIYITLSPYYSQWLKSLSGWGIPRDSETMHGLLFFDPVLQDAYKAWMRSLLEPINPYTGMALKDDPAIALIQLQNEDSLLFWTVNQLSGRDREMLSQRFGDWLTEKYGTLSQARRIWDQALLEGDDFDQGLLQFYNVWELTQPLPSNPGKAARLADQTQFWTETMHRFNAEMVRFLREDIGAQQLINAGNWKTASPVRLNDAERYSYTAAEVIGVNRYYGSEHIGEDSNWAILNGHRFTDASVLLNPRSLPTNLKQVQGHPMIISESSWVPPLSYQSEGPFLVSVFQSLTGIDGFYWFNASTPQWRQPSSANGFRPSLGKWVINTPELLGNFPAAALMYRKGYIQQGSLVVQEQRSLEDLWRRRSPLIAEDPTFDPNRDREVETAQALSSMDINPLAFLVGPVEVSYGGRTDNGTRATLAPEMANSMDDYIDTQRQRIRSITGEVEWDYKQGICTLNAPKAQGVTGFLRRAGRRFELGDVRIESGNRYATVLVVSMDDRAIATSEKLLVQVGTRARSTGWEQQSVSWEDEEGRPYEGFEILNYGEAPWQVESSDIDLTIQNPGLRKALVLDLNGRLREEIQLNQNGNQRHLRLPTDAKYLVLTP